MANDTIEKDKVTYQKALDDHDWFYSYSDDPRVYNRGLQEEKELKATADILDNLYKTTQFTEMLDKAHKELF